MFNLKWTSSQESEVSNAAPSPYWPPMESSHCWPIQTLWQRVLSACRLLFRFHQNETAARHQIQLCDCMFKEQFSSYGISETLVTDNGPQFTSHEFHQFSRDFGFLRVSPFPHHHKANGKVESSVKVARSLIKKAFKDNKDPWVALLGQRNTLTESLGTIPTQRLMSCSRRTLLFRATNLLYPKLPGNFTESWI